VNGSKMASNARRTPMRLSAIEKASAPRFCAVMWMQARGVILEAVLEQVLQSESSASHRRWRGQGIMRDGRTEHGHGAHVGEGRGRIASNRTVPATGWPRSNCA